MNKISAAWFWLFLAAAIAVATVFRIIDTFHGSTDADAKKLAVVEDAARLRTIEAAYDAGFASGIRMAAQMFNSVNPEEEWEAANKRRKDFMDRINGEYPISEQSGRWEGL